MKVALNIQALLSKKPHPCLGFAREAAKAVVLWLHRGLPLSFLRVIEWLFLQRRIHGLYIQCKLANHDGLKQRTFVSQRLNKRCHTQINHVKWNGKMFIRTGIESAHKHTLRIYEKNVLTEKIRNFNNSIMTAMRLPIFWYVVVKTTHFYLQNRSLEGSVCHYCIRQGLLYHRTCKLDCLCSWPSLNSYLN